MYSKIILMNLCFITQPVVAQIALTSLDVPADPRSISMGESFVAVKHPLSSLMYNPASYSANSVFTFSYAQRKANFYESVQDMRYHAFSMCYNTAIGEFGLLYNQFYQGEQRLTSPSNPEGSGDVVVYDHLVMAKYSLPIEELFTVGVSLKVFNNVTKWVDDQINDPLPTTISFPFLFDGGVMYSNSLLQDQELIKDELTLGFSLQNFGSDYQRANTVFLEEKFINLPRYARVGFSYALEMPNDSVNSANGIRLLLTGEYRNLLNSFKGRESNRDFWGFGSEITFYRLLSIRLGAVMFPFQSAYGNQGVPSLRYGVGVNLPLKYLGIHTPIELQIDYAGIPLNSLVYKLLYMKNPIGVIHAFTVVIEIPSSVSE